MGKEPVPLKAGGENIAVTEENKSEYVQLLCEHYLCGGIRREIQCLLQGFWDLMPAELLHKCKVSPRELSFLISGVQEIDVSEWRANSEFEEIELLEWFWEI